MKTIIWFVFFIIYQIRSLFSLVHYDLLMKMGKKEKAIKVLFKTTNSWAKSMIKATGAKVTVEGLENIPENETVLFVSNHQGNFDIPLLLGYLPISVGFVDKIELNKITIVRVWMERLHCVFMERDNPRQSLLTILKAIEYLKEGYSMVVFPEGKRSKGEEIGDFKAGSMKLALKSGVKIVPVTIEGTYKLMEEHNKIKSGDVYLTIHPAIDVTNLSNDEKKYLHETVKEKIVGESNILRNVLN